MEQRSIIVFENSIKSEGTRKTYLHSLTKFKEYYKIKDFDSLLSISDEKIQVMLEDYLFYLKKRVSPNSIPTIMAGIELFFLMNRKTINTKILHKMFPSRVKTTGARGWTTKEISKILQFSNSKRNHALIHFLASTGARIGAIEGLQMRHVVDMADNCKAVTLYEGSQEEYVSFLTPEASSSLLEYLEERRKDGENLVPQSPVFRSTYMIGIEKVRPLTRVGAIGIISRSIRKAGLYRNKSGNRYEIQADHGFRKRFNTILKSNDKANPSLVEKLMGHRGVFALDGAYLKPSIEILFGEFKKHIQDLTVDDLERNKIKLEQKESRIKELEDKNGTAINELRQKVETYDALMEGVSDFVEYMRKTTGKPNLFKFLEEGYVKAPTEITQKVDNLGRNDF